MCKIACENLGTARDDQLLEETPCHDIRGKDRVHEEAEVEEVSYLLSKRELRLRSLHCIVLLIVQLKSNYDRKSGF